MKIQSFSIIAGTTSCNASCPFCISKMTGIKDISPVLQPTNWINFERACLLAKNNGISSVIITGKGEPALYPDQITEFLAKLSEHKFPMVEMQTNGIAFMRDPEKYDPILEKWYKMGLGIIAISIVHYESEKNRRNYTSNAKEYMDLPALVAKLHKIGYTVRFTPTLVSGLIDTPEEVGKIISYAKTLGVEQLTIRPVTMPETSEDKKIGEYAKKVLLTKEKLKAIVDYLYRVGKPLITYCHGSVIFDVNGQNVSMSNCLTIKPDSEDIRQMIFYPDGHVRFDWQYKGAIIF